MSRSPRMVLVMYLDPDGLPRAWARGPRTKLSDVRALAQRHLDRYREEKRADGDHYLAGARYTEKVENCK